MRTGRPKVALILTADERRRLDSLAHRSRSAPHLALRARIILTCGEGADSKVVARRLYVTPGTVCKWRSRFIKHRLDGLYGVASPSDWMTVGIADRYDASTGQSGNACTAAICSACRSV